MSPEDESHDQRHCQQHLTDYSTPGNPGRIELRLGMVETTNSVHRVDLDGYDPVAETCRDELMAELVDDEYQKKRGQSGDGCEQVIEVRHDEEASQQGNRPVQQNRYSIDPA